MPAKPKMIHNSPHKYERIERKSDHVVYKCMLPGCPHFLPYEELAIGRISLCWGCGAEVELDREMVMHNHRKRPKCQKCIDERKERILALRTIPMEDELEEEESYEE